AGPDRMRQVDTELRGDLLCAVSLVYTARRKDADALDMLIGHRLVRRLVDQPDYQADRLSVQLALEQRDVASNHARKLDFDRVDPASYRRPDDFALCPVALIEEDQQPDAPDLEQLR